MKELELDTTQFDGYVKELSKRIKVELPQVIDSEAASVCKVASSQHKPAKVGKVKQDVRLRNMSRIESGTAKITVNRKSKKGMVWFDNGNGVWKVLGRWDGKKADYIKSIWKLSTYDWRTSRSLWKRGKEKTKLETAKALKSRGLSGQSWLKLMNKIGFSHEGHAPSSAKVPSVTPTAMARTGRTYTNEFVQRLKAGGKYILVLINTSPLTIKNKGKHKLMVAIRRRKAYFKRNVKDGVFDEAESAAVKYKGIKVR